MVAQATVCHSRSFCVQRSELVTTVRLQLSAVGGQSSGPGPHLCVGTLRPRRPSSPADRRPERLCAHTRRCYSGKLCSCNLATTRAQGQRLKGQRLKGQRVKGLGLKGQGQGLEGQGLEGQGHFLFTLTAHLVAAVSAVVHAIAGAVEGQVFAVDAAETVVL